MVVAQNGVLLRTVLDTVTGDLSDTRTRYLGSRPAKLFRISMQGSEAVSSLNLYRILLNLTHCGKLWGFHYLMVNTLGTDLVPGCVRMETLSCH